MAEKKLCVVLDKHWENKDVLTIKIRPLESNLKFKAGQHCFLKLGENENGGRTFTISSSPKEKSISFTIKVHGNFTKRASKLNKGDKVIIYGPFGDFTIRGNEKSLVFIAGGVGITPFISIIKDLLEKNKKKKVTLIYSCKRESDFIAKNFFDSINKKWFKVFYVLTKERRENYEYGRIDEKKLEKFIKNFQDKSYYICGPKEMKENLIKLLIRKKVKKEHIKFEDFS